MNWLAPIAVALCLGTPGVKASEVSGEITLDARMVKKSLPPAVYDLRGIAVRERPSAVTNPGDRHRGDGRPSTAATPPCVRVRTRRFEKLRPSVLD
jgi:hypothetical protein